MQALFWLRNDHHDGSFHSIRQTCIGRAALLWCHSSFCVTSCKDAQHWQNKESWGLC